MHDGWQAGESEGRQQAMADLQQRADQPGAVLDSQAEEELEGADRPSEWSGFIYNPYSGDLLPPEDGDDEVKQDVSQPGTTDTTYGTRRWVYGCKLVVQKYCAVRSMCVGACVCMCSTQAGCCIC